VIVRIEAGEERTLIPIKRAPGFAVEKHQKAREVDRGLTTAAQGSAGQSVNYCLAGSGIRNVSRLAKSSTDFRLHE